MECRDRHESAMEELKRVREEGEMQTEELVGKLEDKSKAGKRVPMSTTLNASSEIQCSEHRNKSQKGKQVHVGMETSKSNQTTCRWE